MKRHARITRIIFMLEQVGSHRLGFLRGVRHFHFIQPLYHQPLILGS